MSSYGYGENKLNYINTCICHRNFFETLEVYWNLTEPELEGDVTGNDRLKRSRVKGGVPQVMALDGRSANFYLRVKTDKTGQMRLGFMFLLGKVINLNLGK